MQPRFFPPNFVCRVSQNKLHFRQHSINSSISLVLHLLINAEAKNLLGK